MLKHSFRSFSSLSCFWPPGPGQVGASNLMNDYTRYYTLKRHFHKGKNVLVRYFFSCSFSTKSREGAK